jgi:hypothetical protein
MKEKTFEELKEIVRGMSLTEMELLHLVIKTVREEQTDKWIEWRKVATDDELLAAIKEKRKSKEEASRQDKEYKKKHKEEA